MRQEGLMMGEHKADEFGQPTRTNTSVGIGNPEHGQFEAPTFILLQGLDEEANANPYIVRTPEPGIPLWKIVTVLACVLALGIALYAYLSATDAVGRAFDVLAGLGQ
jgi:hypothetical protein